MSSFNLPSQTFSLPDGTRKPITRTTRVERKTERAKRKAAEDVLISEAVKPKRNEERIPARLATFVRERDENRCKVCGLGLGDLRKDGTIVLAIHVDHIVPRASGGTNCDTNLRCCCETCNAGKGARKAIETDRPPPKPPVSDVDRELLAKKSEHVLEVVAGIQK